MYRTARGPRGPLAKINAGLPVEYVDLVGWFYPQTGDGELWLASWRDEGTDNDHYRRLRQELLGPITADVVVPRIASEWAYQIGQMTQWPLLTTALLPGYERGGAD